jgi:hypothetical protein
MPLTYVGGRARRGWSGVTAFTVIPHRPVPAEDASALRDEPCWRSHGRRWFAPVVPAWWNTPPASSKTSPTPHRPMTPARAASMSMTTRCRPSLEPGVAVVIPVPKIIEQCVPVRRQLNHRKSSPLTKSASSRHPSASWTRWPGPRRTRGPPPPRPGSSGLDASGCCRKRRDGRRVTGHASGRSPSNTGMWRGPMCSTGAMWHCST